MPKQFTDLEGAEIKLNRRYLTDTHFINRLAEIEHLISNLKKISKKSRPVSETKLLTEEEDDQIDEIESEIKILYSQTKETNFRPAQEARNRVARLGLANRELQSWIERVKISRHEDINREISKQEKELSEGIEDTIKEMSEKQEEFKSRTSELQSDLAVIEGFLADKSISAEGVDRSIGAFKEDLVKIKKDINRSITFYRKKLADFEKLVVKTTRPFGSPEIQETLQQEMLGYGSIKDRFLEELNELEKEQTRIESVTERLTYELKQKDLTPLRTEPLVRRALEIESDAHKSIERFESKLRSLENKIENIDSAITLNKFDLADRNLDQALLVLNRLLNQSIPNSIDSISRRNTALLKDLETESETYNIVVDDIPDLDEVIASLGDNQRKVQALKKRLEKIRRKSHVSRNLLPLTKSKEKASNRIDRAIVDFNEGTKPLASSILGKTSLLAFRKKDLVNLSDINLDKMRTVLAIHLEHLLETQNIVQNEIEELQRRFGESEHGVQDKFRDEIIGLNEKLDALNRVIHNAKSSLELLSPATLDAREEEIDKRIQDLKASAYDTFSTLKSLREPEGLLALSTKQGSAINIADEKLLEISQDDFEVFSRRLESLRHESNQMDEELKNAASRLQELHELSELLDSDEHAAKKEEVDDTHSQLRANYITTLNWWREHGPLIKKKLLPNYWFKRQEEALKLKNEVASLNQESVETMDLLEGYKETVANLKTSRTETLAGEWEEKKDLITSLGEKHIRSIQEIINKISLFQNTHKGWFETTITQDLTHLNLLKEKTLSEIALAKKLVLETRETPSIAEQDEKLSNIILDPLLEPFESIKTSLEDQEKMSLAEEFRQLNIDELEKEFAVLDLSSADIKQKLKDLGTRQENIISSIETQTDNLIKLSSIISEFENVYPENNSSEIQNFKGRITARRESLLEEKLRVEKLTNKLEERINETVTGAKKAPAKKSWFRTFTGIAIGAAGFIGGPVTGILGLAIGGLIGRAADDGAEDSMRAEETRGTPDTSEKDTARPRKRNTALRILEKLGSRGEGPEATQAIEHEAEPASFQPKKSIRRKPRTDLAQEADVEEEDESRKRPGL